MEKTYEEKMEQLKDEWIDARRHYKLKKKCENALKVNLGSEELLLKMRELNEQSQAIREEHKAEHPELFG